MTFPVEFGIPERVITVTTGFVIRVIRLLKELSSRTALASSLSIRNKLVRKIDGKAL
ncbi:MAG: hypothetical protein ACFFD4_24230 [Candidatus Odinarchaeota archaeon]